MSYLYGPSFYQAGLLFARAHTLVRAPPLETVRFIAEKVDPFAR